MSRIFQKIGFTVPRAAPGREDKADSFQEELKLISEDWELTYTLDSAIDEPAISELVIRVGENLCEVCSEIFCEILNSS